MLVNLMGISQTGDRKGTSKGLPLIQLSSFPSIFILDNLFCV